MQPSPAPAPEVAAHLARLEATALLGPETQQGSLKSYLAWYRSRGPRRRLLFRALGTTVLVANTALPLLSLLGVPLLLTVVATASSAALAVIAFFNLQTGWSGPITAQLQLESAWNRFEVARAAALGQPDTQAAIAALDAAMGALAERVAGIVEAETRGFFDTLRAPAAQPGSQAGGTTR